MGWCQGPSALAKCGYVCQIYESLQQVLKDYCVLSELKFWANRMEMRHITQKLNETFQDDTVRAIALADTCQWRDKDEQIICALIFGANHKDAQRKEL